MLKFFKYCFFSFVLFFLLVAAVGVGGLYYMVAVVHVPEIEEAHIAEILARESPVYYRDGQAKIGVLFEGIHRQYLTYNEIPKNFVNALVAAEDNEFFSHYGVDIPGIARAMFANLKAGRVVQGGSTITQQTAKNLFKRESRSLKAKIKELLFALRLEHKYSKEKIFEFYSNQFFVSGNGHGLGVAARYFFDKEPENLTLLECAFVAGSVKRPNYYNPFLRKNAANADQVRQRIEERVNYVLGRMLKARMIDESEYNTLEISDLVFNQGKMSFTQNTAMDLVKEGLETPFIADILEENGISNISTSGARIITSLDQKMQDKTVYALRRQLSQLDIRLRGYPRTQVQAEYQSLRYPGDTDLIPGAFVFGTIKGRSDTREQGPIVHVTFNGGLTEGIVDSTGLERTVFALAKFKRNAWAKASPADRKGLLNELQTGDKIYVSIRDVDDKGRLLLDLERYPKVQGGAIVLQEGAIRAMSGGMSNRYYNRATTAKRLMGSTFKPFLFAAALQLGWSSVDLLNNTRDTFYFMGRPYSPQPDHKSPFSAVSLSWAGVTSENVAAVWLLYHLTDHLTPPRIRELARQLDMAPRVEGGTTEDYQHYVKRIRDHFGIIVTRGVLDQASFVDAVKALKPDFLFDDRISEYNQLLRLDYDSGYLGLRSLYPNFLAYRQSLRSSVSSFDPDSAFDNRQPVTTNATGQMVRDTVGRFIYTRRSTLPPNWITMAPWEIADHLATMMPAQVESFWQQVQLDGVISAATLLQVDEQLKIERGKYESNRPYTLEILGEVRDFRIMLGLQYLARLAKACGVDSDIAPVLSLPLGSNVVSLSEITRMYETLVTGRRHDAADAQTLALAALDGHYDPDGAAIIERIETPEGRVVYSRQVVKTQVIDAKSAAAVANILQNTITYGTGRYAYENVRLHSEDPDREKVLARTHLPYPLLGKTGTANDYRNAAFVGYVPVLSPDRTALTLQGGYAVGVYTGYDTNLPMVKSGTRVSGSLGALPAWSDIAQSLLDTEKTGDRLDIVDLTFNGLTLQYPDVHQVFVPVNPQQGGAVVSGAGGARQLTPPSRPASLSFGEVTNSGHFEPERQFAPFWKIH
jgi:membrane peptidoglycan carboxypeptidase